MIENLNYESKKSYTVRLISRIAVYTSKPKFSLSDLDLYEITVKQEITQFYNTLKIIKNFEDLYYTYT